MKLSIVPYVLALLSGLCCVFGFAPFAYSVVPVVALIVLFFVWWQAASPRVAAKLGFVFGLGLFSAGVGWVFVAMSDFGGMPWGLAGLATLLFSAFWALFPALAGYLQAKISTGETLRLVFLMPAIWVLLEWLRGLALTGFPWLVFGYAHSDDVFAGYAPILGVYGVSWVAAVCAGALLAAWYCRFRWWLLLLVALLCAGGALLRTVAWTSPTGAPIQVALLQGNIEQHLKFRPETLLSTITLYQQQVLQTKAKLVVLPETAFPLPRAAIPDEFLSPLKLHAQQQGGDVLIGSFSQKGEQYFNSVFSLGTQPEQQYHKQHLVPFGEFIPLSSILGVLINDVLHIPMSDLGRGSNDQAPLNVAGQKVAVNICYEDVFGEELIRSVPMATLLVNVTNDAWYGQSHAAAQHNQIAQLRALESGRMMLRATNTGVTSVIGVNGKVLQSLPEHQAGILLAEAQGYHGVTPYVRWGNSMIVFVVLGIVCLLLALRKRV